MMSLGIDVNEAGVALMHVTGTVTGRDYDEATPRLDQLIAAHGRLRALVDITDFHGMTPKAVWDDLKMAIRHHNDIGRLAVIGNRAWEAWLVNLPNPFLSGEVRYFKPEDRQAALAWLESA